MPYVFDLLSLAVLVIGMVGVLRSGRAWGPGEKFFMICLGWACIRLVMPVYWLVTS
ncbi:hypothetical protein H9Q09_00915 [Aurantimonas sp. DM33-3]|uniref:hypothetical protein n=1 Tax=Aurantimonas sp. DM33-3 TaxID=2766955 RepID=UPI0016521855|nr:hypothetical protein [Aurantimonas sp. DM33-3]MBC6714745.1 hypothetical protein [Aurantimonas sp. DM33-3]